MAVHRATVLAAAFVAIGLVFSTTTLAAGMRGVMVKLKASEAANAADAGEVRLYESSHALVIGIDAYRDRAWPRLSKGVSDARAVAAALEERGFEVTLHTNLTGDALEKAFEDFFIEKGRDRDARLFAWFGGHGHTVDGEGYLIPADGADPRRDEVDFLRTALSLRRFGEFVRQAKSKHVMAVFDSCFAGTIFQVARSRTPPAITRVTTEPVRQFLSSGDAGQQVSDDGAFASLFVDALKNQSRADANGDGYLTGSELGSYLTYEVSNVTNNVQTPRYGKLRASRYNKGDFVFVQPSTAAAARAATGGGMTPEMLFWQSIQDSTDPEMFAEYLRQYPTGSFGGLARLKMKKLQGSQIAALPPTPEPAFKVSDMDGRYVALKRANVRAEPDAKARKVTTLDADTLVTVTGRVEGADWYRIAHAGGDAYVWKPLLAILDKAEFSAWSRIKGSRRYQDFEKFLKAHPKGLYADRASRQLAALTPAPEPQVAVARPAPVPAPRPQSLRAGDTFRDCDGALVASSGPDLLPGASFCGPQMVVVPAGSFDMGDLSGDGGADERPVHRVTIPRSFAVGVYEVTQAEWLSVTGNNPSHFKGDRKPVEQVSWNEAKDFVRRLSAKTGKIYRLLSEAEWEYVARAGSRERFPWGNDIVRSKANYRGSAGTHPVSLYSANAFGLYNTVGNVWEWTEDCWNNTYKSAPSNGKSWTTGDCRRRVLRGGSWLGSSPSLLRSANRFTDITEARDASFGLRIARTLSPKETALYTAPKAAPNQIASVRPAPVPQTSSPVRPAVGVFPKTYKPGDTFRDCADCPEMVVVPSGSFRMGDLNGNGDKDEKPVHDVRFGYSFAVGKYEVTQAEWRAVMANNPSHFKGARKPVESVSWDDVQMYLHRLNAKTGREYRLLSEAEWEYAARAGSRTKFPWGDAFSSSKANSGGKETGTVGSYGANAFGLFDMIGNVWEWTEDCVHDDYNGAPSNGSAWTTGYCLGRVLRGGSWYANPYGGLRSADRNWNSTTGRRKYFGFRVALTLSRP